jgi:hypothetical protein
MFAPCLSPRAHVIIDSVTATIVGMVQLEPLAVHEASRAKGTTAITTGDYEGECVAVRRPADNADESS